LAPYTTLFRSNWNLALHAAGAVARKANGLPERHLFRWRRALRVSNRSSRISRNTWAALDRFDSARSTTSAQQPDALGVGGVRDYCLEMPGERTRATLSIVSRARRGPSALKYVHGIPTR